MAGFAGFLLFFGIILYGGYMLARHKADSEAESNPTVRLMRRGSAAWDKATPIERANILQKAGIGQDHPHYTALLVSSWKQLDLNAAALIAAAIEFGK